MLSGNLTPEYQVTAVNGQPDITITGNYNLGSQEAP
jgi:hypothetical protein